ncbi:MAG: pirin family protein [Patescibacteria group bacterium]|nr:MAG: pirin family protein [Patescibacteria group bacterium]
MIVIRRAHERGSFKNRWLDTRYTFSFADYFDEAWMGFKTLRVMNEDRVAPGKGFDLHGHRDMEILTYVMQGSLRHTDTMGNNEVINAGEFQRMTAGSGVQHMELNASQTEECHLYQIWILPNAHNLTPGYEQKSFASSDRSGGGRVLVASPDGREGSLTIHQDAEVWLQRLAKGEQAEVAVPEGKAVWIQVVSGEVSIAKETLATGDGLATDSGATLQAHSDTECLVFYL